MDKISVMISSVSRGLVPERDAIKQAFADNSFIELMGVDPYNISSVASSSSLETINIARSCDLYILILSKDFGFKLTDGKSATEVEFDAAFKSDPTKVLVFLKEEEVPAEPEQKVFIERVTNYYSGNWRSSFKYSHELQKLAQNSFKIWLKQRASLGTDLNYLDHFVRIGKQLKPEPTSTVYYSVSKDLVELSYSFWDRTHTIQFSSQRLYNDFWGCVSELQTTQRTWTTL